MSASSILSSAGKLSSGQVGAINLEIAKSATLENRASISIQNDASSRLGVAIGRLPQVTITAPYIRLLENSSITAASTGNLDASDININFGKLLYLDPSSITTSANQGNGGAINIAGPGAIFLQSSMITTSAIGGNGGNISIKAGSLAMQNGFIQANTNAAGATGGDISIQTPMRITYGSSLYLGGNTPHSYSEGDPGYNVIQAAAPTGISGNVAVTPPALDLAGSLRELRGKSLESGSVARNPCQVTGGSSLSITGRSGLPPSARELLGGDEQPLLVVPDIGFEPVLFSLASPECV